MHQNFGNPVNPVVRAQRKKGSRQRTSPPLRTQAPSVALEHEVERQHGGDFGVETEDQMYGRQDIAGRQQFNSTLSQESTSGSPPWASVLEADHHGIQTSRTNKYGPTPLHSPQIYSRKPYSPHSLAVSPQSTYAGLQSPASFSPPLHMDSPVQGNRFPHHPPANMNAHLGSTLRNYETQASHTEARLNFRSFDTLEHSGHLDSLAVDNVVLSGYDGWLDISSVSHRRIKLIGRLDIEGDIVLGAKIVPSASRQDDLQEFRPLVAVIVHGPVRESSDETSYCTDQPRYPGERASTLDWKRQPKFRTRVEVRSLKGGSHIATLYRSPLIDASNISWNQQATTQQQIAGLTIDAQGDFVIVASGLSGEVFVFTPSMDTPDEKYRCIAKFWTSIRKRSMTNTDSYATATSSEDDSQTNTQAPIFALSQRWLAITPPSLALRYSVRGVVPTSLDHGKPPGVESVTAPAPPASNCALDIPDPQSLTNKVAKGVAKEMVRGVQWVGAQSLQVWQNYWNKPSQPTIEPSATWNERIPSQQFPPTHALHQRKTSEDFDAGNLVSIIDLQQFISLNTSRLRNKQEPIATFATPAGCSFLSFSPNGLSLLTVSQNGDTQHVWDLLQLRARKVSPRTGSRTNQPDPKMRQIARFSRFTNASVVDVAWSAPKGDKIAMVTEKGTVHVFKLPASAFMWPVHRMPRSPDSSAETAQVKSPDTSSQPRIVDTRLPIAPPSALASAASRVTDTTRPIVETVRQRSTSGVSMLTSNLGELSFSPAGGLKKGKALAAGVSKSLGVAAGHINQIRRTSESRFSIKRSGDNGQPGCVRFLTGPDRGFLGAVSHDTLVFHWLHSRSSAASSNDCQLPLIDTTSSGIADASGSGDAPLPASPHSFYRPRAAGSASSTQESSTNLGISTAHAHAELETCAPFQPFYTDPRVALATYIPAEAWDRDDEARDGQGGSRPWAFGTAIPSNPVLSDIVVQQHEQHDEAAAQVLEWPARGRSEAEQETPLRDSPAHGAMEDIQLNPNPNLNPNGDDENIAAEDAEDAILLCDAIADINADADADSDPEADELIREAMANSDDEVDMQVDAAGRVTYETWRRSTPPPPPLARRSGH